MGARRPPEASPPRNAAAMDGRGGRLPRPPPGHTMCHPRENIPDREKPSSRAHRYAQGDIKISPFLFEKHERRLRTTVALPSLVHSCWTARHLIYACHPRCCPQKILYTRHMKLYQIPSPIVLLWWKRLSPRRHNETWPISREKIWQRAAIANFLCWRRASKTNAENAASSARCKT